MNEISTGIHRTIKRIRIANFSRKSNNKRCLQICHIFQKELGQLFLSVSGYIHTLKQKLLQPKNSFQQRWELEDFAEELQERRFRIEIFPHIRQKSLLHEDLLRALYNCTKLLLITPFLWISCHHHTNDRTGSFQMKQVFQNNLLLQQDWKTCTTFFSYLNTFGIPFKFQALSLLDTSN